MFRPSQFSGKTFNSLVNPYKEEITEKKYEHKFNYRKNPSKKELPPPKSMKGKFLVNVTCSNSIMETPEKDVKCIQS